jgi:hypothetical protein
LGYEKRSKKLFEIPPRALVELRGGSGNVPGGGPKAEAAFDITRCRL